MRIFLCDHVPFVLLYFFNMLFLFIFCRNLGGFETLENLYYFIFLTNFLLSLLHNGFTGNCRVKFPEVAK
jgi:OmpR family two-component system sensor histidine kinase YxdK